MRSLDSDAAGGVPALWVERWPSAKVGLHPKSGSLSVQEDKQDETARLLSVIHVEEL